MDLIDKMNNLASRIKKQSDLTQTEEATKAACVMPFLQSLGYDVFDPSEVIPEFTADVGIKKGEKVDYAIKKGDDLLMIVECKWQGEDLCKKHTSQLYRYFGALNARFAILTNGIKYHFYSDIDETNKMDATPFFKFNVLEFQAHEIKDLKKFTKSEFCIDEILATASVLKYTNDIKNILEQELDSPSEDFIRFFASRMGVRLTKSMMDIFSGIVKEARLQFVNGKINERLNSAMVREENKEIVPENSDGGVNDENVEKQKAKVVKKYKATGHIRKGFDIVKDIFNDTLDVDRLCVKDTKSYTNILLDNSIKKCVCRFRFGKMKKFICFLEGERESNGVLIETKIEIDSLDDLYNHKDKFMMMLSIHDNRVDTLKIEQPRLGAEQKKSVCVH